MSVNLRNHIENTCSSVISSITSSNLNYAIQQTPFSLYITIRKSLQKSHNHINPDLPISTHDNVVSTQEDPCSRCQFLEVANSDLRTKYEEEVFENEQQKKTILEQHDIVDSLHDKLNMLETEVKAVDKTVKKCKKEKTFVEEEFERVKNYLKEEKVVNLGLEQDLRTAKKSSKKAEKDATDRFNRVVKSLEDKIEELETFKAQKIIEEKESKNKTKKVDKKLKSVQEREAKLKIDLLQLAKTDQDKSSTKDVNLNEETESPNQVSSCPHLPHCVSRQPYPPPHGPPTLAQYELTESLLERENEVKDIAKKIVEFYKSEPNDDIDLKISRLEAIKNLLAPGGNDDTEASYFDDLIELAKETKEKIEALKNELFEDVDEYSYDEDDVLRFYWGGEDCCEMIFYDDDT